MWHYTINIYIATVQEHINACCCWTMSLIDLTAFFSRILQQVNRGANRAGTWTRKKVLNIREERRKSTTATATTATTGTRRKSSNGEASKCESKHKRIKAHMNSLYVFRSSKHLYLHIWIGHAKHILSKALIRLCIYIRIYVYHLCFPRFWDETEIITTTTTTTVVFIPIWN